MPTTADPLYRVITVALQPAREGLNERTWRSLCSQLGMQPVGLLVDGWEEEIGAGGVTASDGTRMQLILCREYVDETEPHIVYSYPPRDDPATWGLRWVLRVDAQSAWPAEEAARQLWERIVGVARDVGLWPQRMA